MYPSLETEGRIHALKMALAQIPKDKKIIHHSDRGTQFCSKDYTDIPFNEGHRISMTEENHCYENPVAERINKTLNSNSGYIILLIVLKKLKSPSIKPPAFTTHSGCISISVISLLILFIKLHNFCQLDFRSLQFLRKAVCFFIFISCILNSWCTITPASVLCLERAKRSSSVLSPLNGQALSSFYWFSCLWFMFASNPRFLNPKGRHLSKLNSQEYIIKSEYSLQTETCNPLRRSHVRIHYH